MLSSLFVAALTAWNIVYVSAQNSQLLNTGKSISPPQSSVIQPVGSFPSNLVLSPDGKFAVSSDSGFRESLQVISTKTGKSVSHVDFPSTPPSAKNNGLYYGLAFSANGTLYASMGCASSIAVLHLSRKGILTRTAVITLPVGDVPAGLALDKRGYLYAAINQYYKNYNPLDIRFPGSVRIYDLHHHQWISEFRFGKMLSSFPYAVTVNATGSRLYVSSERDGLVTAINASHPTHPYLMKQLHTGSHPIALLFNHAQTRLLVANAHSDTISIIDTSLNAIIHTIPLRPISASRLPGVTPTGLALSRNENTLYASLGDMNAVAVVSLRTFKVSGLIPAGWYPTAVVLSPDGARMLVANAKGTQGRYPNPLHRDGIPDSERYYIENIIEGNVITIRIPNLSELPAYTHIVMTDNNVHTHILSSHISSLGLKSGKIRHIIYIIKENRTYDQILGDMKRGNGDPNLCLFGKKVTPNLHALAARFVLLDNFLCSGEVSGDGWTWSTESMGNEYVERSVPYNYSNRGLIYNYEGQNNGYLVGGHPEFGPDGKKLPDLLFPKGAKPVPDVCGIPTGRIWDQVRQKGISMRNYGFFLSFGPILPGFGQILPDNYPDVKGLQPPGHDLAGVSDYDFRRFTLSYPDSDASSIWYARTHNASCLYPMKKYGKYGMASRFAEWDREFKEMLARDPSGKSVPAFMTVRFMMDHTEGLSGGAHSPRSDVADNDFAVGELVQAVSHSPIWKSTAIFIIEDDAQDGPDHVDAHRSTCYVVSPWIRAHTVDHHFYNTDSVLHTMELLLGIPPMSEYDAFAQPIGDWDTAPRNSSPFTALLPPEKIIAERNPRASALRTGNPMRKLIEMADKMDFTHADAAPAALLNKMIWASVHGMKQ